MGVHGRIVGKQPNHAICKCLLMKISEKNKSDIIKLKDGEKTQDEKMIKLKSEILSSISSARY